MTVLLLQYQMLYIRTLFILRSVYKSTTSTMMRRKKTLTQYHLKAYLIGISAYNTFFEQVKTLCSELLWLAWKQPRINEVLYHKDALLDEALLVFYKLVSQAVS